MFSTGTLFLCKSAALKGGDDQLLLLISRISKKKFTLAAIELLKFAPCNKIRTFHLGIEPTLQCAELLPAARDSRIIL